MAINIPDAVFTKYKELADAMISTFGILCTLVYPEFRNRCENCITNTIGGRSSNTYRSGGPIPFNRGLVCPLCNGRGFKLTENTEDITLRVYWNKKDWVDVDFQVDVPDNFVQTIGYISDLPKLNRCKQIIINKNVSGYETYRFVRASESYPFGLKQDRYVATFWRRA